MALEPGRAQVAIFAVFAASRPVARYPTPVTWPSQRAFGDLLDELSRVEVERDIIVV